MHALYLQQCGDESFYFYFSLMYVFMYVCFAYTYNVIKCANVKQELSLRSLDHSPEETTVAMSVYLKMLSDSSTLVDFIIKS